MLTGRPAFTGETITDILAAVVKTEPDLTHVPRQVRRLIQTCLQKDPTQRLQAIGDWRLLLEEERGAEGQPSTNKLLWAASGVLALALVLSVYHFARPATLRPLLALDLDLRMIHPS
jgi:serine/threonine-protein kinase